MALLSDNAYAKTFTIQNESVNMLVVNGTTGNILLNPNAGFGNVGIGTTSPSEKLVVIGSVNISGYLNISGDFKSAGSIYQAGNQVQTINAVFNLGNYSTEYASTGYKLSNYSSEYALTGWKRANTTDFLGGTGANDSLIRAGNMTGWARVDDAFDISNYSTEYASTGYKLANFTSNLNSQNSSLWNRSVTNVYLRFIDDLVGIGTITPDSRLTIRGTDADANLAGQPGLLHLNITDSYNRTVTNFITLDHNLNNPANSTGGIGIGILFRAINNDSELVNVSFINATLVNAINGSEASALSFYTRAANGLLTPKLILNGSDVHIAPTGGSVGIGTAGPSRPLDVAGSSFNMAMIQSSNTGGVALELDATATGGRNYFIHSTADAAGPGGGKFIIRDTDDSSASRLTIDSTGNVGIGTTGPQNKLEVIGAATFAGGVNASSLNVTGFSITDDSLVTVVEFEQENKEKTEFHNQVLQTEPAALTELNDKKSYRYINFSVLSDELSKAGVAQSGTAADSDSAALTGLRVRNSVSKPKSEVPSSSAQKTYSLKKIPIKDIKAGQYALSLDESTGKLVPRKVNALLDHGIKPIYEMATEDGRSINTTAEHPYLARLYERELCDKYAGNVWNKEADEFNEYCTRWVEVQGLNVNNEIATPKTENDLGSEKNQNKEKISGSHNMVIASVEPSGLPRLITNENNILYKSFGNSEFLSEGQRQGRITWLLRMAQDHLVFHDHAGSNSFQKGMEFPPLPSNPDITFKKIVSIKQLPPQHVYDLAIEGTRNFIANDIVAHNTYLATSSGNVGIGTIGPDSTLHINSSSVTGALKITNGSGSNFTAFFVNGSSGRVGIGLTNPSDALHAVGAFRLSSFTSNNQIARITKSGVDTGQISLQNGTSTQVLIDTGGDSYFNGGNVGIGQTSPNVTLGVSGRANISGYLEVGGGLNVSNGMNVISGNVGIGTTSPANKLWVQDTNTHIATFYRAASGLTYAQWVNDATGTTTNDGLLVGVDGSGLALINNQENTALYFSTNNAERVRIDNTGNVGIGTVAPNTKLHVNMGSGSGVGITVNSSGPTNVVGLLVSGVNNAENAQINASLGTAGGALDVGFVGTETSHGFTLRTKNANRVLIDSAGNVGINTTVPANTLTVQGTLNVTSNPTRSGDLFVASSGNVGINTTNPGTALQVVGSIRVSELDIVPKQVDWIANTDSRIYTSAEPGTYPFADTGNLILQPRTDSARDIVFALNLGSTTPAPAMVIKRTTGNVGIGTTSPGRLLEVAGSINGTQLNISGAVNLAYNSGNVGIGTTSPNQTLDVQGSANFANQIIGNNNLTIRNGASAFSNTKSVVNLYKNIGSDAANTWSTGASGGRARDSFVSVLYNGKIYFWGGRDGNSAANALNSTEIYDIATDSWSNGTASATSKTYAAGVAYNDAIYTWGGSDIKGNETSQVMIYNITKNVWTNGTAGGRTRVSHTATLYNGKIYFWGGVLNGSILNTMDVYDINSNSWSNGTSGGAARYSHVAALYNNKIYFWGGWTATFDSTNLTDIYDIANDSWSNGTPGGLARFSSASALYNGKLYIFGGSDDATIDAVNRLDIYDIAKDSWSQGVSGGTARDFLYSTAPVYNGRIYFWGGINTAENRINSMDILDIGDRQSYLSFYENGENMLSFRTGSNINLDYGLLSITGGNLGVGTTHPKARLHVNDSSAVGSLLVTNVSGTAIFFVNGSSGKVGIGTTSPTQKLEISGGSVLIPTGAKYLIGGTTEGIRGSVNSFVAIQTNAADRIVANYGGAIQFLDESANVLMQIQSTGKVGIGATSPNVTFHVSGAANVSGRLSYGTLAANSPHFFETIGKAEPLCIKSKIGKYVGCMIDENFEFVCRIDDRCSRKYLDASLSEEIEHLNRETPNNLVNENNLTNNAAPVRDSTDTSASAPNAEIAQINDNDYKKQKIERLSKLKSGIKEKEVTVKQAIVQLKLEQLGHVDIDAIESEEDAVGYTSKTKKAREEQGNVGINTTVPARTLTVQGTLNVSNPGTSGQLFMDSSGSVGIGTTTPTEVLSVNGNVSIEGTNCRDSGGSATCNNFVDFAELFDSSEPVESGDIVIISFENPPSKPTAGFSPQNPQSTSKSFQNSVDGKFQNSVDAKFQNPVDSSSKIRLTALQNPVDASQNNTQKTPLIYNTESNANNNENSIENPAPDFASAFKVKKSAKPYDSKVIGIVSTQPAIVIEGGRIVAMGGWKGQNNTLKPAIALAGRVPVKVTNENGPIQKGDLLTTSSKAGYGMKFSLLDPANAKDFSELKMMLKENENRRNAVLGKSLENCDQQECKILAFVSMQ